MAASHKISSETLKALETVPNMYLVLSPDLVILTASDLYLQATGTSRENLVGKHIFTAFPNNPNEPEADGVNAVNFSLQEVLRTKKPHYMPIQRYDVPDVNHPGKFILKYWDPSHTPVLKDGDIQYIIQSATDVTEKIAGKQDLAKSREELVAVNKELTTAVEGLEQSKLDLVKLNNLLESQVAERTRSLADTASRLRSLIMNAHYPLMILTGPEWVVEIANPEIGKLWAKPISAITGRKLMDILPELKDQPFPALLKRVWDTGISYGEEEQTFYLETSSGKIEKYINFYYDPVINTQGEVSGIFVSANDITEIVKSRQLLETSYQSQQVLNEELAATNDELKATQEQLVLINNDLLYAKAETENQTLRLHRLFMKAPTGICIFQGPDFVYQLVNPTYQNIFPGRELLGKPLLEALPEMRDQPLIDMLNKVYSSGETIEGKEVVTLVSRNENSAPENIYLNFVYQAKRDEANRIDGVIAYSYEVTEQVLARKKVEESESRLMQALESGEMGAWSINLLTRELTISERGRKLFGFPLTGKIKIEEIVNAVDPVYSELMTDKLSKSFQEYQSTDLEYPIIHLLTGERKWIKVTGKTFYNSFDEAIEYSGIMMDITERKTDELRKNDFIAMVSHELKTPLTSMRAQVQVLLRKAKKEDDDFTTRGLENADRQVSKMASLINGFLNVSRLEAGKIHIDQQPFDMADLVKEIEKESLTSILSHKLLFAPVIHTMVKADRDKIGQVINNLLSNAVKYSPAGSTIRVACITLGNFAQVSVSDEGKGITQADIAHLFDRYYRVLDTPANPVGGFGIGLYVCAEIVNRHGGKIWVESNVGKGSVFYFNLPLMES